MSGREGFKDALALTAAAIDGDEDGQRVIRLHADPDDLVTGLVRGLVVALTMIAAADGGTPQQAAGQLRSALRTM